VKPQKLRQLATQHLPFYAIALAVGTASYLTITPLEAAQITLGQNCKVEVPPGADLDLIDTLFDMVLGKTVSDAKCKNLAQQIAASTGTSNATPVTTSSTQSSTQSQPATSTSSTDANTDSDGDGIPNKDDKEPFVANLPILSFGIVGNTSVEATLTQKTTGKESRVSSTVSRASETSNTSTHSHGFDVGVSLSVEGKASINPFNAEVSTTASISANTSHTWESGQTNTTSTTNEDGRETADTTNETYDGGSISGTVLVRNEGDTPTTIERFTVNVKRRTGPGDDDFESVATLQPEPSQLPFTLTSRAGSTASHRFNVSAKIDNLKAVDELLENPGALIYEVATVSTSVPRGNQTVNFSVLESSVRDKTVMVVVDYGGGKVQKKFVAVEQQPGQKTVTFDQVMKALRLPYEVKGKDLVALCTLPTRNVGEECKATNLLRTESEVVQWRGTFISSNANSDIKVAPSSKFEDTVLSDGDTVFLSFYEDRDKDGLSRNQEIRYGTVDNPANCSSPCQKATDFDGDGLTDSQEINEGWLVADNKDRQVFASPTNADADKDGLRDDAEKKAKTDPNNKDTDGDTIADGKDANPLVADKATVTTAAATAAPTTVQIFYKTDSSEVNQYATERQFRRFGSSWLSGRGTTKISSVFNDANASRAVDGDTSNLSHTENADRNDQWWTLDLSKPQEVRYIIIWNMANTTWRYRLPNFELVLHDRNKREISLTVDVPSGSPAKMSAIPLWGNQSPAIVNQNQAMVVALPTGIEVSQIEIRGKSGVASVLTLAEVEVYGVPDPSEMATLSPLESLNGTWQGTLKCGERERQLTLEFKKTDGSNNPSVVVSYKDGDIFGSFNAALIWPIPIPIRPFQIDGKSWIRRDSMYGIFTLEGQINGNEISGKKLNTGTNCSTFKVTKQ